MNSTGLRHSMLQGREKKKIKICPETNLEISMTAARMQNFKSEDSCNKPKLTTVFPLLNRHCFSLNFISVI